MSYNYENIRAWVGSDYYRELKAHRINYLTSYCTTGLTPQGTVDYLYSCLRAMTLASDKPTRFMAVLLTFSASDAVDQALLEWNLSNIDDTGVGYCICSKNIHYEYYITNTINGNVLICGCDCIYKVNFPRMLKEKVKKQVKIKTSLDRNKKYKQCIRCLDRVILEESKELYCANCGFMIRQEEMIKASLVNQVIRPPIITPTPPPVTEPIRRAPTPNGYYAERREREAREYAEQFDLCEEYKEKLNKYLEDRRKPCGERTYV